MSRYQTAYRSNSVKLKIFVFVRFALSVCHSFLSLIVIPVCFLFLSIAFCLHAFFFSSSTPSAVLDDVKPSLIVATSRVVTSTSTQPGAVFQVKELFIDSVPLNTCS